MTIRVLSAGDLDRVVSPAIAVEAMRSAFRQLSADEANVPLRGHVRSALGTTLLMPAYLGGSDELGAKIVSVFPENASRGIPAIHGALLLLEAATGRVRAVLDGTRLTGLRTAAGSALATELLADPSADVLTVFGAGTQGRAHIEIISATRRLREIRIVARRVENARALSEDVLARLPLLPPGADGDRPVVRAVEDRAEALAGAGIVVTATTSATPVFDGRQLEEGAHVNGVGSFRPDMQEVDEITVLRARVIVDQRRAVWEEAGDLIVPFERGVIDRDVIDAELGEIVAGTAERGRCGRDVTFFKSVGSAAQDVALGEAALSAAEDAGLGVEVPF